MHQFTGGRSEDFFAAAQTYDYGVSTAQLRIDLRAIFFVQRTDLSIVVACGAPCAMIGYAGYTFETLAPFYALEQIIDGLGMKTMEDAGLLGFRPDLLRDQQRFPTIVFYDKLGLRAEHLYRYLPRDASQFDADTIALLGLRFECWK
jgi:hypothetical protein